MTCTPGDPFRDRDVSTNSLGKSYRPTAVTRRKRSAVSPVRVASGTEGSRRRAITSALAARRSPRRFTCQNPSRMQPTEIASAKMEKKSVALRTLIAACWPRAAGIVRLEQEELLAQLRGADNG